MCLLNVHQKIVDTYDHNNAQKKKKNMSKFVQEINLFCLNASTTFLKISLAMEDFHFNADYNENIVHCHSIG